MSYPVKVHIELFFQVSDLVEGDPAPGADNVMGDLDNRLHRGCLELWCLSPWRHLGPGTLLSLKLRHNGPAGKVACALAGLCLAGLKNVHR